MRLNLVLTRFGHCVLSKKYGYGSKVVNGVSESGIKGCWHHGVCWHTGVSAQRSVLAQRDADTKECVGTKECVDTKGCWHHEVMAPRSACTKEFVGPKKCWHQEVLDQGVMAPRRVLLATKE